MMNKGIYSLFALFLMAILTGCAGDTSTHNTTNINVVNNKTTVVAKAGYSGPKFDIDAVIKKMVFNDFECGTSSDAGIWVVTKVNFMPEDKIPANELLTRATIQAKQNIAEWMATEASASTEASMSSTVNNEKEDLQSSLKSEVKAKAEAFMRGVTMHSSKRDANGYTAYFYVTGKLIDRSAELEAQLKAAPPGVVRAVGFGVIVNGKIGPAKREARQAALRNAVEQVMGTTVIANSQLMDNEKAKSKVISQTAGNVKEYRIVKEDKDGMNYQIILNAKVDEKNLLDNYAAMVRSMGNPGFAVKCKDPDLKLALSDFFATLGFKVTADPADTQFVVDADCDYRTVQDNHYGKGIQIAVRLKIFDAQSNQQLLFTSNNPRLTSTYSGSYHQIRQLAAQRAFKTMKEELHRKLNKVVMDWVLNGREVKVVFKNAAPALDETLVQMINDVPCAKYQTRSRNGNDLVIHCSYVGPSADFEEFLRDRMRKDLPKGTVLPQTRRIELNSLEFSF